MSNDMDSSNVIVIAPKVKNEDGSQTFYILDPCPSSEECTSERPESEIEVVSDDVKAEVKNSVAFALLSTNSDTGALEIRLTKKAETEENMDIQSEMDIHLNHLNNSLVAVAKDIRDEVINCALNVKTDNNMDETFNNDNPTDHSANETLNNDTPTDHNTPDSSGKSESVDHSLIDVKNAKIEQDDDMEEGKLYIDDKNECDLKTEYVHGSVVEVNNVNSEVNESLNNPIIEEPCSSNPNTNEPVIKTSESVIMPGDTESTLTEMSSVTVSNNASTDNVPEKIISEEGERVTVEKSDDGCSISHESLIQDSLVKVPSETQCHELKTEDSEYGDSTNTALTLLELAGGTSLRHESIQQSSECLKSTSELSEKEAEHIPCISNDVAEPGNVSNTSCNQADKTVLTALEPVKPEVAFDQNVTKPIPNMETETSTKSESGLLTTGHINDKSYKSQVQRLIEGDIPMLSPISRRKSHRGVVTQNEIVEIFEQTKQQKCYFAEPSKDVVFAMKLAHRLATKIVSPEKPQTLENINDFDHLNALPSSSSPCGVSPVVLSNFVSDRPENKKLSDKIELLKILEDDPEDQGPKPAELKKVDPVLTKIIKKSKQRSPLIKRHPELEKELALKQLQTFTERTRTKKGRPSAIGKLTVKKEAEDNNNLQMTKELKKQKSPKKRETNDEGCVSTKELKGAIETEAVADPKDITESLIIDDVKVCEPEEQVKEGKSVKQYSNKRLSRNAETPPREVPMEILLNGDNDAETLDQLEESTSKNKIFKASNPRKRKEELTKKRQKHFANMLQKNTPMKRRGRPPGSKKKPPSLQSKFDHILFDEDFKKPQGSENSTESNIVSKQLQKDVKQVKTKQMREIERLLGDEGAINMLYSVEQKRATGSEPKLGILPSYRRKKKDLIQKTKLVKTAVLRLSTSPSQSSGRVSLRGQALKGDEKESAVDIVTRKQSVDSDGSHNSLGNTEIQPQPIKAAEASRIIRRHSSSSNYSSRSNSPRRPSVDGTVQDITSEIGAIESSIATEGPKCKGKVKLTPSKHSCMKRKDIQDEENETTPNSNKLSNKKIKREVSVKFKSTEKEDKLKMKSPPTISKAQCKLLSLKEKDKKTILNKSLEEAVKGFIKVGGGNKTAATANKTATTPNSIEATPADKGTAGLNRRVFTRKKTAANWSDYKKVLSIQGKSSVLYNELNLKRHNHLVEINIDPSSTILKNSLNTHVLKELTAVLKGLSTDENCHIVVITSSGNVFCQGVDFVSLIQPTPEKKVAAAHEMAVAIKDFMTALAVFPKPVAAGVQGAAVGLGTAMLPLFDVVFASSTATFHTPYAKLGQAPEGGATLTLPTLYGPTLTSELLLASRKLSAAEAHHFGLVTRILWGNDFHDELIAVLSVMASQSTQAMDATKALLRHNMLPNLETALVSETHLLMQHWAGDECQANFKLYTDAAPADTVPADTAPADASEPTVPPADASVSQPPPPQAPAD